MVRVGFDRRREFLAETADVSSFSHAASETLASGQLALSTLYKKPDFLAIPPTYAAPETNPLWVDHNC